MAIYKYVVSFRSTTDPVNTWNRAVPWNFQQCGMCDQQGSDQKAHMDSLVRTFASCLYIIRLLSCWSNITKPKLKRRLHSQAHLSLFMSKCHIVGNHVLQLIYWCVHALQESMHGIRNFIQGGGGQVRRLENSMDKVFFIVLKLFYN